MPPVSPAASSTFTASTPSFSLSMDPYHRQRVNTSKYTFFIFHFTIFYPLSLPQPCSMTMTTAPSLALPDGEVSITPIHLHPRHTPIRKPIRTKSHPLACPCVCMPIYRWVHPYSHANPHTRPTARSPVHACPSASAHRHSAIHDREEHELQSHWYASNVHVNEIRSWSSRLRARCWYWLGYDELVRFCHGRTAGSGHQKLRGCSHDSLRGSLHQARRASRRLACKASGCRQLL